ncbi:MAG TPA: energy transducer TonB [Thermoanaerobaculia bacterium]|nr:energy transducer TonB [Thermoanaerobaculia bacterium]
MPSPQPAPRRAPRAAAAALLMLAAGAVAPCVAAAAGRDAAAAELLARAQEHHGQGRYAMAAEAARQVVALGTPADVVSRAANTLGLVLYRQWTLGLEDASKEHLERLFYAPGGRRVPPAPSDELLEEAAEAFRLAIELDPDGGDPMRLNLAQALHDLERNEEASAVLDEYVQRGGTDPEALALRPCLRYRSPYDGEPLRVEGEVSRPEKIGGANPAYTDLGRYFSVEGVVVLEAVIDEAGDTRCIHPLKRLPLGMTEAATTAVSGWKFKPATLAGKPVKVYYTLTVTFILDDS